MPYKQFSTIWVGIINSSIRIVLHNSPLICVYCRMGRHHPRRKSDPRWWFWTVRTEQTPRHLSKRSEKTVGKRNSILLFLHEQTFGATAQSGWTWETDTGIRQQLPFAYTGTNCRQTSEWRCFLCAFQNWSTSDWVRWFGGWPHSTWVCCRGGRRSGNHQIRRLSNISFCQCGWWSSDANYACVARHWVATVDAEAFTTLSVSGFRICFFRQYRWTTMWQWHVAYSIRFTARLVGHRLSLPICRYCSTMTAAKSANDKIMPTLSTIERRTSYRRRWSTMSHELAVDFRMLSAPNQKVTRWPNYKNGYVSDEYIYLHSLCFIHDNFFFVSLTVWSDKHLYTFGATVDRATGRMHSPRNNRTHQRSHQMRCIGSENTRDDTEGLSEWVEFTSIWTSNCSLLLTLCFSFDLKLLGLTNWCWNARIFATSSIGLATV